MVNRMTIVIDTNIIVSALLNPNGVSYTFMDRVFAGEYEVIVTESILEEYNNVLRREKFKFSESIIETIIEWFRNNAIFIDVNEDTYLSRVMDPQDAVFYAAARCTKARLVTGNIKHYPVEEMITMLWEIQ